MKPLKSLANILPRPERGIFLTGTGTGVGKTHVAAFLAKHWNAAYWKPVQTGSALDSDRHTVQELAGLSPDRIFPERFIFEKPVSPHQAAEETGVPIRLEDFILPETAFPLVVEGAGGVCVPLDKNLGMPDLIRHLGLPVWLVSGVQLGSINHTLLSLEVLEKYGLLPQCVIFSGPANPHSEAAIMRLFGDKIPEWWRFEWNLESNMAPQLPKAPILHPFTRYEERDEMLEVVKAEGEWLQLRSGEKIVDACGSWWTNIHGHCHPYIVQKMHAQLQTLDHVIFAGITHPPAEILTHKLLKWVGSPFSRIFYSDNGSTATEVALKLAWQWWKNQGETRKCFMAFDGAYHGDTFGAMAVGERDVFVSPFRELLFDVTFLPFPEKENEVALFKKLEKTIREKSPAALIFEPLIQGAAGMHFMDRALLAKVLKICKKHGILLIADEVFTGFGRTGKDLGIHHEGLQADILCLSKALTAGVLPMGATLFTEEIYSPFASGEAVHQFFHGHSFTGNPLGCAAALANLELYEKPEYQEKIIQHYARCESLAEKYSQHPGLKNVRAMGAIFAASVQSGFQGYFYHNPMRKKIFELGLKHQVLLRPLGNVVYVIPPYNTDSEAWKKIETALEAIANLGIQNA